MADVSDRELDVVVFGCTGDTGSLGCCWLYFYGKKLGIQSWAPAARNADKMKTEVLDKFSGKQPGEDGVMYSEPVIADSGNYESLVNMCKRTKVVLACAGPYEKFGEDVMRACCEVGTHYVDVTGEYFWVAEMEAKYGAQAIEKGITLVSCAGYDSVPPDLSTFLAAKAVSKAGDKLGRFDLFMSPGGAVMPSGTIETSLDALEKAKSAIYGCCCCGLCGGGAKKEKDDVELGKPINEKTPAPQYVPASEAANLANNTKWNMFPSWSSLGGQFSMFHFMAPVNINIVHRTAAQEGYGGLVYRERWGVSDSCLSLFGLLPMLCMLSTFLFGFLIAITPCGTWFIKSCVFSRNPDAIKRAKSQMFSGCKSTGKVDANGYGVSANGKVKVSTKLYSPYDAGLGFTMQSSTMVAGLIVQRSATENKPRPGFQTAVRSLGGDSLVEGFGNLGVKVEVSTEVTP